MLVKYIGRVDQITTDYNGKRYVFQKCQPITEIPKEVFLHIQREATGNLAEWLEIQPEIKIVEKIVEVEKEEKKRGRPKKEK
jgi:hypothetical protein